MACINLQKPAVEKIMEDHDVSRWLIDRDGDKVPLLGYFHRSHSEYHDGTIVEYGDGFMLTSINPQDAEETRDIVIKSVALAPGADILVGGDAETMSRNFGIGWSKWKFTYEPMNHL